MWAPGHWGGDPLHEQWWIHQLPRFSRFSVGRLRAFDLIRLAGERSEQGEGKCREGLLPSNAPPKWLGALTMTDGTWAPLPGERA